MCHNIWKHNAVDCENDTVLTSSSLINQVDGDNLKIGNKLIVLADICQPNSSKNYCA